MDSAHQQGKHLPLFFFIRKLTFHTFSSNFLLLHFLLCCSLLTPLLDHVPCRKLTCLEGKFRTYTEFASHIPTSWSRENVPFFACVTNVFMGAASLKIGFPEKLCKLCGSVSARLSSLKTMVGKNEVGWFILTSSLPVRDTPLFETDRTKPEIETKLKNNYYLVSN